MRVLFLNRPPSPLQPWYDDFVAALDSRYPVERHDPSRPIAEQMSGVGVVIDHGGFGSDRTLVDAAVQAGVKLWQVLATGVDNVDTGYFREKGLPLANTPGPFSAIALAEHALFLMLALAKNYPASHRHVRAKRFYDPPNEELHGKILGLIGCGASGRELARRAGALGMRVWALDAPEVLRSIRDEYPVEACLGLDQLDDMLREADYVSLHVPLTERR
jgi:lactate dehydrogenase-like 2-hydroxyacid dehydrogenase